MIKRYIYLSLYADVQQFYNFINSQVSTMVDQQLDDAFFWKTAFTQQKGVVHIVKTLQNLKLDRQLETLVEAFLSKLPKNTQQQIFLESSVATHTLPRELTSKYHDLKMSQISDPFQQWKYANDFKLLNSDEYVRLLFKLSLSDRPEYAFNSLGVCYDQGFHTIDKNPEKAFDYYQQSAMLFNSSGLYNLAECYYFGYSVAKIVIWPIVYF